MRTFLFGVILGAIGGMLYAPSTGNRTRALLRDKYTHYSAETLNFIDRHSRDIENRMQGVKHDLNMTMEQVRGRYDEVSALVHEQAGPIKEQLMGKVSEVKGIVQEKVGSMRSGHQSDIESTDSTDPYRQSA